jgi:peptide/nickel transport system substrate-binding protein
LGTSAKVAVIIVIIVAVSVIGYYAYTNTSSSGKYKDTIVLGTTDSVQTTIDPADAYDYFGDNMINNLGAPLVDFAPGTTDTSPSALQPALATSWAISSDGLNYTFILRSGVKYADGQPFNASDVAYSFNRGISLNDPNGAFVGIGYGSIIKSVTALNNTAVRFTLKQPFAPFLSLLTFAASYPVEPSRAPMNAIVNFTSGNVNASNPNGLGPYVLTEWTRSGTSDVEMKLDANPNYWNYPNYPQTKHIIIKFYTDPTALAAAIQSGDVDIAYRQFTSSSLQTLQTISSLKVYSSPGAFIQYLVLNENIAPFNNSLVRQAVASALNRTDLINTVFLGTATPLYSQIPNGMFAHIDAFKTAYGNTNLTKAEQLLQQAGYSTTNKLVINFWYESSGHYPQSGDQATVIKSDLEKTGMITVDLHGETFAALHTTIAANTAAPMWIYGWYPDFIDPYDYTFPFFHSPDNSWLHYGYNSSTMNSLIEQAIATSNLTKAQQLYSQIQTLQAQDVPIIPMFQGGANCCGAVAKTTVSGVYLDVTLIFRMYTLRETS